MPLKRLFATTWVLVLAQWAQPARPAQPVTSAEPPGPQTGVVTQVIDGDTLRPWADRRRWS